MFRGANLPFKHPIENLKYNNKLLPFQSRGRGKGGVAGERMNSIFNITPPLEHVHIQACPEFLIMLTQSFTT